MSGRGPVGRVGVVIFGWAGGGVVGFSGGVRVGRGWGGMLGGAGFGQRAAEVGAGGQFGGGVRVVEQAEDAGSGGAQDVRQGIAG